MGTDTYFELIEELYRYNCTGIPESVRSFLDTALANIEVQNKYGKLMVWIGIYIAVASLFCILPMVADLLHGLKNKKLWFPCKYFTLHAASLTIIAVAMKLPMDLTSQMPYDVDKAAKLGSLAFMCTMMANLLPSLATLNSKELVTNIIALGILVITLVVNVCIQLAGPLTYNEINYYTILIYYNWVIATFYAAMLLAMLMIHTCSALMILKSKQILESKYKAGHETALKDLGLEQPTVEKLKQHVINHWIMAGTGSPQFMTISYATTSASGAICVFSAVLHVIIMLYIRPFMKLHGSDYKWSTFVILIIQFTGVILGTAAPLSRCLVSLSFKVSIHWIWNHISVFKVESYCTQKLSDLKQSSIPLKFSSRRCMIFIQDLKFLILNFCIGIQMMVVEACKMIALIPVFFVIGILCCFHCWKRLKVMFGASYDVSVETPAQLQHNRDLSQYVLQLQDDMELAERTLKSILKSVNRLIQSAEKQQPNNLMKLLEESSSFEAVGQYELHEIPHLPKEMYVDCWSLPVVTLTAIAISLPNIQKEIVDRLIRGVSEGHTYVKHVEETRNATDDYVSMQKAAKTLWLEIEVHHKWLGNKLSNPAHQVNTPKEIVQWFSDKAKNMAMEVESKNMKGSDDSSLHKSVSANSMYQITQTILASYHANIDQVSQEELFAQLSSRIAHILAACLTNLPHVIAMKCHTSAIKKREASVHTAAVILGETMLIINSLQDCKLPFIDKGSDLFLHTIP